MKDVWEFLYEKAFVQGDRPITGKDLARMIDEAKRAYRQQLPADPAVALKPVSRG